MEKCEKIIFKNYLRSFVNYIHLFNNRFKFIWAKNKFQFGPKAGPQICFHLQ